MTEEKKKDAPVMELNESTLEKAFHDCIWTILVLQLYVRNKQMKPEEAETEVKRMTVGLMRALMVENPNCIVSLPYSGKALADMLQSRYPERYGKEALPPNVNAEHPHEVVAYACWGLYADTLEAMSALDKHAEVTEADLKEAVNARAAYWAARFLGQTPADFN